MPEDRLPSLHTLRTTDAQSLDSIDKAVLSNIPSHAPSTQAMHENFNKIIERQKKEDTGRR